MKSTLFACDLDNTLIYSKNRPHEGFLCVERIHDKEQGYMSPRTIELLEQVNGRTLFVPVTTRSVEQYLRIRFPEGCRPEYAAVANGAILLKDGRPVPEWSEAFREKNSAYFPEIDRMYEQLKDSAAFIRCRKVDDAYMFVYCGSETNPAETGKRLQAATGLKVAVSGKKIYLFPPELHKGTAVRRLLETFRPAHSLSAGDGPLDVPMLLQTEKAVAPLSLRDAIASSANDPLICPEGKLFAEFVLEMALTFG